MFLLKLSCIKLHSTSLEQSSCIVIQFQILLDYNTLKKCIKITGKIRVTNIDMHFHSNTGQQTDSITQSKSWFASGKEKEQVYSVMYCVSSPFQAYVMALQDEVYILPHKAICPAYFVGFFEVKNAYLC